MEPKNGEEAEVEEEEERQEEEEEEEAKRGGKLSGRLSAPCNFIPCKLGSSQA